MQHLLKYGQTYIANILNPTNNITFRNNDDGGFRTQVIVVGCGGTGGRIIPLLAQHISNHNKTVETVFNNKLFLKHKIKLTLVDLDDISSKNLRRQNFYTFDVGKYKSEVMAERYGALYGMPIEFHTDAFDKYIFDINCTNVIIFDCTDNKKARESIENSINGYHSGGSYVLISCGNEEDFGQVIISQQSSAGYLSTNTDRYVQEFEYLIDKIESPSITSKHYVKNVPTLLELYRDFQDTEKPSCTDIELIDDQSMPINSLVAQVAYNVFYMLIAGKSLNYHMVKCNINNTFTTSLISYPLDMLNLLVRGIYGESNEQAIDTLKAYLELDKYSTDVIIQFFNTYDRKYTEIFYDKYVTHNYSMSSYINRLNWRK